MLKIIRFQHRKGLKELSSMVLIYLATRNCCKCLFSGHCWNLRDKKERALPRL